MGASISSKFSHVNPLFDIGIWRVCNAIQKSDGKPVSIWMLEYSRLKEREKSKRVRKKYMTQMESKLRAQMKISHPAVLEIWEIASAGKKMGFTSEPVTSVLSNEKNLTRDEAVYVVFTLANAMKSLHTEFRLAFGSLTPENLFLTHEFRLKLGLFVDAAGFRNYGDRMHILFAIDERFCAPEMKTGWFSPYSDVFMFGMCCIWAFTGKERDPESMGSVPPEYRDLISSCTAEAPMARPTFEIIVRNAAFSSMVCEVFQFLELIQQKRPNTVVKFFDTLRSIIHVFSLRMLRLRFLRIFVKLAQSDPKYGLAVMPMMFKIHDKFDDEAFVQEILRPLLKVIEHWKSPKLCEMFLDHLSILFDRISVDKREELVYPVLFLALRSENVQLLQKALEIVPYCVTQMPQSVLEVTLVTHLVQLIEHAKVQNIAAAAIGAIITCTYVGNADVIASAVCPAIRRLWKARHWSEILPPTVDLLYIIRPSPGVILEKCMRLAGTLLSDRAVDLATKAHIILFMNSVLNEMETVMQIHEELITKMQNYEIPNYMPITERYVPSELTTSYEILTEEEFTTESVELSNTDTEPVESELLKLGTPENTAALMIGAEEEGVQVNQWTRNPADTYGSGTSGNPFGGFVPVKFSRPSANTAEFPQQKSKGKQPPLPIPPGQRKPPASPVVHGEQHYIDPFSGRPTPYLKMRGSCSQNIPPMQPISSTSSELSGDSVVQAKATDNSAIPSHTVGRRSTSADLEVWPNSNLCVNPDAYK